MRRILVVDDSSMIRSSLRSWFSVSVFQDAHVGHPPSAVPVERTRLVRSPRSAKGLPVLPDPLKNLGEAKFVAFHRAVDEIVASRGFDLDAKAVAPQKDI